LIDFWKALQAHEDAYFDKHGHYFQLLTSPELKVIDGIDGDFVVRLPDHVKDATDTLKSYTSKVPFQVRVDTFDGQGGKGYKANIEATINGKIYRRERYSDNLDSGWYSFTPSIIINAGL
jgi:hypothetical protein